jgi:tetratricopeptide (TPR) repeat protein
MLPDDAAAARVDTPADPRDPEQWLTLGLDHLDARRPAAALAAFDRALALQPELQDARYDRLLALRQLGRTADLGAEGVRYTRDFPRDARGWSYHGRNLAEGNDLAGACAAFTRAVELDPSTASYRNNLAATLSRQSKWREAAEVFAQVHALDPIFPDAAFNAAAAYSRAGDQARAWRWVEICLTKGMADPARLLADNNLAALRASPQWDSARVAAAAAAAAAGPR